MDRRFVGIAGGIIGDQLGGSPENLGIAKVLSRCRPARRQPEYGMEGGIHDDPTIIDQRFDHDMFAEPPLIEQEKAARVQAAALRQVHERIGRGAANLQELAIVEGVFRITSVKGIRIRDIAARGAILHPGKDRLDFLLGIIGRGDNRVRKTFQVTSRREFPTGAVQNKSEGNGQKDI